MSYDSLEQQFQHLMEQQLQRSLTEQERKWVLDNFPEHQTQLESQEDAECDPRDFPGMTPEELALYKDAE